MAKKAKKVKMANPQKWYTRLCDLAGGLDQMQSRVNEALNAAMELADASPEYFNERLQETMSAVEDAWVDAVENPKQILGPLLSEIEDAFSQAEARAREAKKVLGLDAFRSEKGADKDEPEDDDPDDDDVEDAEGHRVY